MLASKAETIPIIPEGGGPSPSGRKGGLDDVSSQPASVLADRGPKPEMTGLDSLTHREQEVLQLISRGHYNAEIAEAFLISEGTVKTHVKPFQPWFCINYRRLYDPWHYTGAGEYHLLFYYAL